eukprot:m.12867 g.12867  ORF g.12867 m.12867 type:complete len:61 (+) comp7069_c0_seq1:32-214(+)
MSQSCAVILLYRSFNKTVLWLGLFAIISFLVSCLVGVYVLVVVISFEFVCLSFEFGFVFM